MIAKPLGQETEQSEDNEASQSESAKFDLTRRAFIRTLGAGLLVSVIPGVAIGQRRGAGMGKPLTVAARLHVGRDGVITVMTGKIEAGQGSRAQLTQAAAEELRVPVSQVRLIMGDTQLCPNDGTTAGSRTTPSSVPAVRRGAATARNLLIGLACRRWKVDATSVEVRDGMIVHSATKRALSYADLAAQDDLEKILQEETIPADVQVTAVKQWKILGTSVTRPNARDLVTGAHRFPSDIVRPDMLYSKVLRPPSYGAKLLSVDLNAAQSLEGVVVVRDEDFVGCAAPTSFEAAEAIEALARTARWETAPHPSSKEVFAYLKEHAEKGGRDPVEDEIARARKVVRAVYNVAYVQHTPMEPRAAVAEWKDGTLTAWTGTQSPFGVQAELVRTFGLPSDQVRVIVPDMGGGFGGKHTGEVAVEAARLARAAKRPVSLRWTREEEFIWAYFRPAAVIEIQAGLDERGTLVGWYFVNINSGGAAIESPYNIAHKRSRFVRSQSPLRQGSYRCLAATANNFARECFMDELAEAAGSDPLSFRLAHIDNPRLKAVLETAAKRFDWQATRKKKDRDTGFGLACGTEKGSYVAACVEIGVDRKRDQIEVKRVGEVFECGAITSPANLLSQVQGCILMGLGPALREEMLFENGKVLNATLAHYQVPRFADVPQLDIHLLNRPDLESAGAGETPIIVIAPAIANAVFDATGARIRSMPITLGQT